MQWKTELQVHRDRARVFLWRSLMPIATYSNSSIRLIFIALWLEDHNHILILSKLKFDEVPSHIPLFHVDFWVEVNELPIGFMSKHVENFLETSLEGLWNMVWTTTLISGVHIWGFELQLMYAFLWSILKRLRNKVKNEQSSIFNMKDQHISASFVDCCVTRIDFVNSYLPPQRLKSRKNEEHGCALRPERTQPWEVKNGLRKSSLMQA